jgi:hypothetical protein
MSRRRLFIVLVALIAMLLAVPYIASAEPFVDMELSPAAAELFGVSEHMQLELNKDTQELEVVRTRVVSLQTKGGYYVAEDGSGEVNANRSTLDDLGRFLLVEFNDGRVALRTSSGAYLRADNGGGANATAATGWVGHYKAFTPVWNGSEVSFRTQNGKYLTAANSGGSTFRASASAIGDSERFRLIERAEVPLSAEYASQLGVNGVALVDFRWHQNNDAITSADLVYITTYDGHHVTALHPNDSGGDVMANADDDEIRSNERFLRLTFTNGKVAFVTAHGTVLSATGGGGSTLKAPDADPIDSFERFTQGRDNQKDTIKSHDGDYLRAVDGGGKGLNADRTSIGNHERFVIRRVDDYSPWGAVTRFPVTLSEDVMARFHLPQTYQVPVRSSVSGPTRVVSARAVALQTDDGHYVDAEGGGGAEVDAKASNIGSNETWLMLEFDNGKVAFRSHNGAYLRANFGGGSLVQSGVSSIGNWELFSPVWTDSEVSFKSQTGHYLRAVDGGGKGLNADRTSAADHERFTLIPLGAYTPTYDRRVSLITDNVSLGHMGYPANTPLPVRLFTNRDIDFSRALCLKAPNGKFLRAEATGGVFTDRSTCSGDTILLLLRFKDGSAAFRTVHGHYLALDPLDGRTLKAVRDGVEDWGAFSTLTVSGGIKLQALNGSYLATAANGVVSGTAASIDSANVFAVTQLVSTSSVVYQPDPFVFNNSAGQRITSINNPSFNETLSLKVGHDTYTFGAASLSIEPTGQFSAALSGGISGGIFDRVQFGSASLMLGYQDGATLKGILPSLPIHEDGDYLYVDVQSSAAISIGGLTFNPPINADLALTFVLDPLGPTLYVNYGGMPDIGADGADPDAKNNSETNKNSSQNTPNAGGGSDDGAAIGLDSLGFGFSANNRMQWEPWTTWHNTEALHTLNGDFYINGGITITLQDYVTVGLEGDLIMDLNWDQFTADSGKNLAEVIGAIGVNSTLTFGIDAGGLLLHCLKV